MPAYSKICDYCGAVIKMVRTRNGWLPFEEDNYGVSHKCVPPATHRHEPTAPPTPALELCGSPTTRRTPCWWCGEPVFYHTNGNGDSVLFDELGWPWQVHPCWEEHREARAANVQRFLKDLTGGLGKPLMPRSDWPIGVRMLEDTEANRGKIIPVGGYVHSSSYYRGESEWVLHCSGDYEDWNCLHVVGLGAVGYVVWLPSSSAMRYRPDDLVQLVCRFVPWESEWYLVAIRATVLHYPTYQASSVRLAKVGRTLRCQYCGDALAEKGVEWGFDKGMRPECQVCREFRDHRSPERFRDLCRKVSRHGRM
jgi:hypothetical protein